MFSIYPPPLSSAPAPRASLLPWRECSPNWPRSSKALWRLVLVDLHYKWKKLLPIQPYFLFLIAIYCIYSSDSYETLRHKRWCPVNNGLDFQLGWRTERCTRRPWEAVEVHLNRRTEARNPHSWSCCGLFVGGGGGRKKEKKKDWISRLISNFISLFRTEVKP